MRSIAFHRLPTLDYQGTEAINTICSNLSFAGVDIKKIVLTSCNQNDGKSFLTVQIAINLAQRGKRVLLVDCDLRKSRLVSRYGVTSDGEITGLVHYLAGYAPLENVIYRTDKPNFCLIPAGRDIANPLPLLDSGAFQEMLRQLQDQFDLILLDTPPIGMLIDAAEVAKNSDGVVLVVKYNNTHRREILEARRQLEQTGCPLLGCVLNDVTFTGISAKKYYNKYYYSHYGRYYRHDDSKGAGQGKK